MEQQFPETQTRLKVYKQNITDLIKETHFIAYSNFCYPLFIVAQ